LDNKTLEEGVNISGKKKDYASPDEVFKYLLENGANITYTKVGKKDFSVDYDSAGKDIQTISSDIDEIIDLLYEYGSTTGVDVSTYVDTFKEGADDMAQSARDLNSRNKKLDEYAVKEALIKSDVYMWDSIDIKNATLDEAIDEIAD
jgi:hypothetical protein